MTEVVELRQYTLHPGQRDVLIELFDREFVESQEAEGMRILGQFRDLDEPDHFVWMRSFRDMPTRAEALTAFYTGPAWKANSAAANATMIAVDNVLLLRPTGPGAAFHLDEAVRDTPAGSLVVATISHLPEPPDEDRLRFFDSTVLPLVEKAGGTPLALLQTEYAENNFPQLPVRTGEHVVLYLASFPGEQELSRHVELTQDVLPGTVERLRLSPTDRSMLR
ncbi:NIPSNAP family protein [Lentzea flava]|uniref:NIPSNAP family containing protein n=1 Tax=Lentzea flava TaxID=103732 RepID=A0ABQ2UC12_9PSEU|nr:NIPSNAP family protein [Lentzea flava]MCP2196798.1 Quinol monooxygenase YgiN [Lentzea flava]GGU15445.1 NIPSNAP family containing protein [Lentzea flava]